MSCMKKRILALFLVFFVCLSLTFAGLLPFSGELRVSVPPTSAPVMRSLPPAAPERVEVWVGGLELNSAGKEELMTLPGIGEVLAERILAWREENGAFLTAQDLLLVKGIGEKTLEKILSFREES